MVGCDSGACEKDGREKDGGDSGCDSGGCDGGCDGGSGAHEFVTRENLLEASCNTKQLALASGHVGLAVELHESGQGLERKQEQQRANAGENVFGPRKPTWSSTKSRWLEAIH